MFFADPGRRRTAVRDRDKRCGCSPHSRRPQARSIRWARRVRGHSACAMQTRMSILMHWPASLSHYHAGFLESDALPGQHGTPATLGWVLLLT